MAGENWKTWRVKSMAEEIQQAFSHQLLMHFSLTSREEWTTQVVYIITYCF